MATLGRLTAKCSGDLLAVCLLATPAWHSSAGPFKREPIRSRDGRCGGGKPENPAGFWLTRYNEGGVLVPGRIGRSEYPVVLHCELHSGRPALLHKTPGHGPGGKVSAVRWKVVLVRLARLASAGRSHRVNWTSKEADLTPTQQKGQQRTDGEDSLCTGAHGTGRLLRSWFIQGPTDSLQSLLVGCWQ
ncbi:hypothetical protein B0T20DRAFT_454489 [Sordaria brevicollis]|uniref:Secreted protein n=1 Tax=Sordaria brevicollis TaxID=83679 RepID=A0AAE0UBA1_SORBR|nr:hypothetical protein B0T20DRAFT_454489 [Sordaria brevicollis]